MLNMFHAVNSSHLVLFSGKIGGASEILRPFSQVKSHAAFSPLREKRCVGFRRGAFSFFRASSKCRRRHGGEMYNRP